MRAWRPRYLIPALLILPAFTTGCPSDDPAGNGGGVSGAVQSYLQTNIATKGPAIIDAYDRLYQTILGNPQPGVVIIPSPSGGTGSVDIDFDGDGSMETTVSGSLTFLNPAQGISGGASVAIDGITGSPVNGQAVASVFPSGGTSVFITASPGASPSGTFSDGTTTTETYDINVDMQFGGTPVSGLQSLIAAGYVSGSAHFHVDRGSDGLDADIFFVPDGSGGFSTQVIDEEAGIDFTIP